MVIKGFQVCLHHKTYAVFRGRIKNKLSENSITGNKITQYQDNISKEAKVGSSTEGEKIHQY